MWSRREHWRLVLAIGIILISGGIIIAMGSLTGTIENWIVLEGEPASNFSTKTWDIFSGLHLSEGDNATFILDVGPDNGITAYSFFMYIMDSKGAPLKTISRGGSTASIHHEPIEIPFTAPYTDTYEVKAESASIPANSLHVYSSVSILKNEPDPLILTIAALLVTAGAISISISLIQKPKQK